MSDDSYVRAVIAEVERQERELRFATFTNDDAWELGCLLVRLVTERGLPVTVDVRRGTQQLFHAARPGTVADNDTWVERKVRVVERFGTSSYLQGCGRGRRARRSPRRTTCRSRSTRRTAGRSRCTSRASGWSAP